MTKVTKEEFDKFVQDANKSDMLGTFYEGYSDITYYYSHKFANKYHIIAPENQLLVAMIMNFANGIKAYCIWKDYFSEMEKINEASQH